MVNQYEIFLVNLDPTIGHEIKKIRPSLIISPNEMNDNINTVIIAPMSTKSHNYPTRNPVYFNKKNGWIILDQIRTIDRSRLIKSIGRLDNLNIIRVKDILKEMLID